MKKKLLSVALMFTMTMGLFTGCGNAKNDSAKTTGDATETTTSDSAEGSEGNVLRVGMECAYAPFNWTQETEEVANGDTAVPIYGADNSYAYGYDVMMAKKIAEKLGMGLEVHKVEWDSIGMAMDSGEYDCIIAGMGKTAEREQAYSFTGPYYYRDICLTVKKDSDFAGITKLSDFKGKNPTVTTQLGTAWVDLLDQIPDVQLGSNYETTAECFMAVSNGVADVCVIDKPTSESALLTNNDLVMLELDEDDTIEDPTGSTNVCIATRKDDTALRDKIQGAMDELGWDDKAKMDEMMDEAIKMQPAAN
ncbi:MAG: transporter substrate-binding domain-containing protein [Lachnospiraceae bacterium]